MFERKGSDALLPDILKGDTKAMTEYYYRFHHTSPETQPGTKENWKRSLEEVQKRQLEQQQRQKENASLLQQDPYRKTPSNFE